MKKVKNILLLSGIILYIVDICFNLYSSTPWNTNSKYFLFSIFVSCASTVVFCLLPVLLLVLNLKNKYNKVFFIIAAILSVINLLYHSIDPFLTAVPEYLILSKLGLIDTPWVYVFSRGGILRKIGSIMITIGAILSCKNKVGATNE